MKPVIVFALLLTCVLLLACSGSAKATPTPFVLTPDSPTAPPIGPSLDHSPTQPPATAPATLPHQVTGTATDVLNIRAGPGLNYAVKGQLQEGDTITIVGKSADGIWWQCNRGWVSSTYIQVTGDASTVPVSTPPP